MAETFNPQNILDTPYRLVVESSEREISFEEMDLETIVSTPWALKVFTELAVQFASCLTVESTLGAKMRVERSLVAGGVQYLICKTSVDNPYKSTYEQIVRIEGEDVKSASFCFFGSASYLSLRGGYLVAGGSGVLVLEADTFRVADRQPHVTSALLPRGEREEIVSFYNGRVFLASDSQKLSSAPTNVVLAADDKSPQKLSSAPTMDKNLIADFPGGQFLGADEKGLLYLIVIDELLVLKLERSSCEEELHPASAALSPVFRCKTGRRLWPGPSRSLDRTVCLWGEKGCVSSFGRLRVEEF